MCDAFAYSYIHADSHIYANVHAHFYADATGGRDAV
jgi:hypothetical protein